MCFPKFINHLSQTNYTNCIARLQRQKKVEHPGNHFRFVKMKKHQSLTASVLFAGPSGET